MLCKICKTPFLWGEKLKKMDMLVLCDNYKGGLINDNWFHNGERSSWRRIRSVAGANED
jgi:hypothetical protein